MVLALVSMLFLIILPQFRMLYKSWELKEASAETNQHGRVLFDHLHQELATATAVSAMSDAGQVLGYLEYFDADGQAWRYEAGSGNYVYFGPPGDLSLLAGPVIQFQVSGYTADDLDNPTADVDAVRLVRIQSEIESPSQPGRSRSFSFSGCIRPSEDSFVIHVLLVVVNPSFLNTYEQRLYNRLQSWGYAVALIDNSDTQTNFDTAVESSDAAYVPASCDCQDLGTKLTMAPIGVVSEHRNCHDDLRYTNQAGGNISDQQIRIYSNSNPITAFYTVDEIVTVLSFGGLNRVRGSSASGFQPLAMRPAQSHAVMGVIETGGLLSGGQAAPARRVMLPWGSDAFDNSWLNDEGWGIVQRAIEWAAGAT